MLEPGEAAGEDESDVAVDPDSCPPDTRELLAAALLLAAEPAGLAERTDRVLVPPVCGTVVTPVGVPLPVVCGFTAAAALVPLGIRFPIRSRRSETRRRFAAPRPAMPAVFGSRLGRRFPTRPPRAYEADPPIYGLTGTRGTASALLNLAMRSLRLPLTMRVGGGAAAGDVGREPDEDCDESCCLAKISIGGCAWPVLWSPWVLTW